MILCEIKLEMELRKRRINHFVVLSNARKSVTERVAQNGKNDCFVLIKFSL